MLEGIIAKTIFDSCEFELDKYNTKDKEKV